MSYFWAEMTSTLLRKAGPGFCPSYLIVPSSVPWKWAYWSKFEFEKLKTTWEVFIVSHLKSWTESRNRGRVKIVCFTSSCRFRELPELVIVVLDPNQGGDHGEGSVERSVHSSVDQQLVGEGGSVAWAGDVDIVHVSGGNLLSNFGNQIQNELDIISLALLSINIP